MTVFYLDTSAAVELYVQETGTGWLQTLLSASPDNVLYTARLTGPELIAALFSKARRGQVSVADALRAATNFRADWGFRFSIVEITGAVTDAAMNLAQRHGLRGYDAVHIAAAREVNTVQRSITLPGIVFITADRDQLQAAQAEGLQVDNPDLHP